MAYVYIVTVYDEILFITSELYTAIKYWKKQPVDKRPDIFEWKLGFPGMCERISDEEIMGYVQEEELMMEVLQRLRSCEHNGHN